ncbi:MAG: TolC family protein [Candidatus Rokubacteria bacterium]|nr:TolC family protein [Candidatus Rokubacteria bacterium]
MRPLVLVAALLLGVAACAVPRAFAQYPTPAPAPSPPVAPAAAPPSVAGRVLTLEEAIAIALETQPQIQARLSDYAAAQFRVDQALAPLLPQISGSWTAARAQNVSGSPGTGTTQILRTTTFWTDSTLARVSASQLLFDFGKTFAATDVAKKNAEMTLEDLELQRQLVTLAVKESYTNINFAQRLIKVQLQALERAELNLKSARGFFEVGTRPKSDVTRAEVDVANARLGVIQARNAERVARVALNTAMGIAADTPTQIRDNLVEQKAEFDRRQLLAEALGRRPEYKQEQLRVDAADAFVRQTFRNFLPDITGGGFYGAQRADMNEVWELNIGLTWSIYDGGNRIARYREAKASLEAARARVKARALDISREVEQAQLTLEETDERIQAAQAAVASAQENFRLAQGRFDAGVGTILELTDAQLALTQAQNTEAQALADHRIAVARLERAIGRR